MYTQTVVQSALSLPRFAKRFIVLAVDVSLCVLTVWLSYFLRIGQWVQILGEPLIAVLVSICFAIPVFVAFGLYRAIFRYSGWSALLVLTKACAVYGLMYATLITTFGFSGVPRTVGIIQPILLLLMVAVSRLVASYWLGGSYRQHLQLGSLPRVLIYGAGSSGRQLAAALRNSRQMQVVGFLDDDRLLVGQSLNGLNIYSPLVIQDLVNSFNISDVLLALPQISRTRRNEILSLVSKVKVSVRTLPSVSDLAKGKVKASDLRELDIEDLLGRDPVAPNFDLMKKNIFQKTVMVTGAGGSIGSELCRQILFQQPTHLILIDQSEYALYNIEQELSSKVFVNFHEHLKPKIVPVLASVVSTEVMEDILEKYKPKIIFHAAAYKHVPLVEANVSQGVVNNVFGTLSIVMAAKNKNIERFILVSTDKAVRPTNVMGATKRIAEMILQAIATQSGVQTIFSMVRFGNVLDSSGSVVPLFRKQICDGGPVTLTHPDVTRYFMTIPEAAQLVIQSGAMAQGGDVFVLDMGEPVKIFDLAKKMIQLSGFEIKDDQNPEGDIEIKVTGLRPGEKLYEELLIGSENYSTSHPRIFKAHENFLTYDVLSERLRELDNYLGESPEKIKTLLRQLVPEYCSIN